jgi:two-component system OmpR family response regulator
VEVRELRWPRDRSLLDDLRRHGVPRLVVVDEGMPPLPVDGLEDFVFATATPQERQWRRAAVAERARRLAGPDGRGNGTSGDVPGAVASGGGPTALDAEPAIDDDGIVRFAGRWASISPVESSLLRALIERFGAVVSREHLGARAWPEGLPTRNALDVHILRLRRRIAPLGLEVRTVRSRGYMLHAASSATDDVSVRAG